MISSLIENLLHIYLVGPSTGLDSSTRGVETNEPKDLLLEDISQSHSQVFSSLLKAGLQV